MRVYTSPKRSLDLNQGKQRWQRRRGATLIELSVVVVIIALIIAGALVSFLQAQRARTIASAVEQNTRIIAAVQSLVGSAGLVGAGVYVEFLPNSGIWTFAHDFEMTVADLLDDVVFRIASEGDIVGLASPALFRGANPWGEDIELLSYNLVSIVVRHHGVPTHALQGFANVLDTGAAQVATDIAGAEALRDNADFVIASGSDYELFADSPISAPDENFSFVDGLYLLLSR